MQLDQNPVFYFWDENAIDKYCFMKPMGIYYINLHSPILMREILYRYRKQCITSESQFDFLKELVENIPDLPTNEEEVDDFDEPKRKR